MKDLLLRSQAPEERAMVLSAWKRDLWEREGPRSPMRPVDWWALTNYVVDEITYPTVSVHMACYQGEPRTPLCWIVVRDGLAMHLYAKQSVMKEPELAAYIERELRKAYAPCGDGSFDPFEELRRREP